MKRLLAILLLLTVVFSASAQRKKPKPVPDKTRVLLILDCSNSMWDQWQSDSKIKVTQQVMLHFIDSVAAQNDIDVALRVFGHLNKDAYGTRLEVPFGEDNSYKLQSKIKTLVPNGGCTAATALTDALHDFPVSKNSRNIILIITDGIDDSDGSICNVARQVQLSGIVVQTFILGIGNPSDFDRELDCAGKFTYVPNEEQYADALYSIFKLSDEKAFVMMELEDSEDQPLDGDVPVAFYDSQTGVVKYLTRCMGGAQDTFEVDPLVTYDLTFFTQPVTTLHHVEFAPGVVSRLAVGVSQGQLRIRQEQQRVTWPVPKASVVVRPSGESQILATQQVGETKSYLSGVYDVDVLCVPPIKLKGVEVREKSNTDLSIPMPGLLTISKPKQILIGSIFVVEEGVLTYVCDLNPNAVNERLVLQPGEYQLEVQQQNKMDSKSVKTYKFKIDAAKQTDLVL